MKRYRLVDIEFDRSQLKWNQRMAVEQLEAVMKKTPIVLIVEEEGK